MTRYFKLWWALARFSLVRELAFRVNFLVKIFVEVLWLGILLVFYDRVFASTSTVADWSREQYLFFLGCYFTLEGLMETFFLENCNNFADLVRTGDLDFYLLKPIDEQFLVSCKMIDWSCAPKLFIGAGIMSIALYEHGWVFHAGQVACFLLAMILGTALGYGFLLMLTSVSVWFMRNQSLFEMWWLFSTLMRYPREIFQGTWASPVGWVFSFVVPIMLVSNVPARTMVQAFEPGMILYMAAATAVVLWVSRRIFRMALARYRSASS